MPSVTDAVAAWALRNRRLVRAPIWLYQHGLGRLLGHRVLMLEHTGRRSGSPRYVCLEVVEQPSPDQYVVVSGFGEGAQWYQNLRADPRCRLSVGRRRQAAASARFMTHEEAESALGRYRTAHPRAWRRLRGAIEQAVGHPVGELPMVLLTVGPS